MIMRILVTRTDRLGDVILATPVLKLLRAKYPEAKISFLVQKHWMPILQFGDEIELLEYDPSQSLNELSERLRVKSFDRAYILRDERKVSRAIKKAGVPERVGPYSTFRSFFLFNQGKLQRRSRCEMHEAEYNLDLIDGISPAKSTLDLPSAWVQTSTESVVAAKRFICDHELEEKEFYVIHPGSSGSARYVSPEKLFELAQALLISGKRVLVTGGPLEDEVLVSFKKTVPAIELLGGAQSIGLDGMAEVYRRAKAVIAHGTGPLHLAAAVGAPTLAIFPPIFVLSEKRWGPLIANRAVWAPNLECPAKYRCLGEKCRYYDCMNLFEVNSVLKLLESITK